MHMIPYKEAPVDPGLFNFKQTSKQTNKPQQNPLKLYFSAQSPRFKGPLMSFESLFRLLIYILVHLLIR